MATAYSHLEDDCESPDRLQNGSAIEANTHQYMVLTDIEPSDEVYMLRSMQPKDYFKQALAVIFCCWLGAPLGVAALRKSRKVRDLTEEGELSKAQEVSRQASTQIFIGLALGVIGWALLITILLIYHLTKEDDGAVEALSHGGKYNIFVPNYKTR